MFTLEIIDQLIPGGIARGRKIAGTGTMNLHGEVGPIEGVALKRVAAERVGADVFLVPAENATEARAGAQGIEVVPVHTLREAMRAVQGAR